MRTREEALSSLRARELWDLIVIGGGATGLGTAVDAAQRGYSVLLLEQSDFGKGTSSRSTKLVHGGVRYLQQGNVTLVMEALKERGLLLQNAPHLVHDVAFIVPSYKWWSSPFYGIGLKVYDFLAGKYGFGKSSILSKEEVKKEIPSIQADGLLGGTRYFDGQFDDARLAINLAATAEGCGAVLLNYMPATALLKDENGILTGVQAIDEESGETFSIQAKVIVNATGPFADSVRQLDNADAEPIIAPSQGVHIVLDKSFLPGDSAIMVPNTDDGRVMFAIPWHSVTVVGTTDTPIQECSLEPKPLEEEIDFILSTANRYLAHPASRSDILSVFTGIRPLVKSSSTGSTASLSRDHSILIDPDSGLMTVAGGKWTTYRKIAEDVVDQAMVLGDLEPVECQTKQLRIHGYCRTNTIKGGGPLEFYGADAENITALEASSPELAEAIHPRLPLRRSQVVWGCRAEAARTVEDILARRTRCLLFDAHSSLEAAEEVSKIMATELKESEAWCKKQVERFRETAAKHIAGEPND